MPFRPVFEEVLTIWSAVAGAVFFVVVALLLFAIVRNRASRRSELPYRAKENNPLEGSYTLVLFSLVALFVVGSFLANNRLSNGAGTPEAEITGPVTNVAVSAHRWCWNFDYRPDAPVTVTSACTFPQRPTVVVPAGETVDFALTSADVIHEFWVPAFDVKRYVFPDHVNHLRMSFPVGRWFGECAEYCGTHHVTMRFWVQAVPPDSYQRYLASGGTHL